MSDLIEHREWCPPGYADEGFAGQRIAVVGHSHWSDDADDPEFTRKCMSNVIAGAWDISFFNVIPKYFEAESRADFWSRVMFFNFLPSKVGGGAGRFGYGTREQLEAGRARVLRILDDHQPDNLFVFSTKAWNEFPLTIEGTQKAESGSALGWKHYETAGGKRVKAIGLRHPQGSPLAATTERVSALMGDR